MLPLGEYPVVDERIQGVCRQLNGERLAGHFSRSRFRTSVAYVGK